MSKDLKVDSAKFRKTLKDLKETCVKCVETLKSLKQTWRISQKILIVFISKMKKKERGDHNRHTLNQVSLSRILRRRSFFSPAESSPSEMTWNPSRKTFPNNFLKK